MDAFKGKFERTSAEGYDEIMKELDVNFLLRLGATISTPMCKIYEEDGGWMIKTYTILKTLALKFKLGEPFEETSPDGREVNSVVTLEDGKIVTVQKAKVQGEKSTRTVREMNGADELIYTMYVDGSDVVCVQKFKRVA